MKKILLLTVISLGLASCAYQTNSLQNQVLPVMEFQKIPLEGVSAADLPDNILRSLGGRDGHVWSRAVVFLSPSVSRGFREALENELLNNGFAKKDIIHRVGEAGHSELIVQSYVLKPQFLAEAGPVDDYWLTRKAIHPSFGMATNYNLSRQVANSDELERPRKLGSPNPMASVGAVERYQKGEVRPLSDQTLEAGKTGDN
jgi:type IV pilus biogenesis protein CpaD/CtpE